MTDRLDLPPRYREMLDALLQKYVPNVEVWAYGSRINGRCHEGSDLDLVLRSPTLEPLDYVTVSLFEAVWATGGACREHSWAVWFAEMPHPDAWLYRLNKI